ncbi:hypothetical protein ACET3Z_003581 [Daucus carota]
MALSYYYNWSTQLLDQHLRQDHETTITSSECNDISFEQDQLVSEDLLLPPELLNFHDNFDTCIDTLFTPNNHFLCSGENVDAYNALFPAPGPLNIIPALEMAEEAACFDHFSKRSKIQENYFFSPEMTFHDNYDMGPLLPEFVLPELPVPMPAVFNEGCNDYEVKKAGNAGGKLSQQSIAARVRRRKITEKTQELGKLIPGGQKMNTAEMFQAASKYIKFMQAQIGLLQLMQEENDEGMQSPELESLVTSPLVQEKLYSAEKCLVPEDFVKSLIQKPQLQSNPQLIKDLIKLI